MCLIPEVAQYWRKPCVGVIGRGIWSPLLHWADRTVDALSLAFFIWKTGATTPIMPSSNTSPDHNPASRIQGSHTVGSQQPGKHQPHSPCPQKLRRAQYSVPQRWACDVIVTWKCFQKYAARRIWACNNFQFENRYLYSVPDTEKIFHKYLSCESVNYISK